MMQLSISYLSKQVSFTYTTTARNNTQKNSKPENPLLYTK